MTPDLARDEILKMFVDSWETDTPTIPDVLDVPLIIWPDENTSPNVEDPYVRPVVLHLGGGQGSLGGNGGRRFYRTGIFMAACYGPLGSGKGLTIAEKMANIALCAFEGKTSPGGIWFRNCRINEVGLTESWYQVNAVAEFLYDEVK